jgi:hypothetical protein
MQNLVADLSICQEAFNKGVKIESEYYWQKITTKDWKISSYHDFDGINSKGEKEIDGLETIKSWANDTDEVFPAPLTDEILEKLPWYIGVDNKAEYLTIFKEGEYYRVGYGRNGKFSYSYDITYKKLSNALLKLLIKLKEENII